MSRRFIDGEAMPGLVPGIFICSWLDVSAAAASAAQNFVLCACEYADFAYKTGKSLSFQEGLVKIAIWTGRPEIRRKFV